jgi:hypothetical protein
MREIQYEIVKEIAVLSTGDSGYTKEINLISWNGKELNIITLGSTPSHA